MRSSLAALVLAGLVLAALSRLHAQAPSSPPASARQGYHVIKQTVIGGDGNWDYVTVDPDAHRVYVPRGTHVQVLDESTHKLVADIPGMKGLHGVAIVPKVNRGFVTGNDPKGVIYVFDLKTNAVTSKISTGEEDCDGLFYDPATDRVYVQNGDSMTSTVIDPAAATVVGTIKYGGPLEAGVSDGKGSLFVNLVDSGEIAQVDARSGAVKSTFSSKPCQRGYGAAFDVAHRRLFVACQGAMPVGVVINADTGKVVASMPIAAGSDGVAYDPATGDVFFTCRDSGDGMSGVVNIFHEESPDKYTKVTDVKYMYGARTIAVDPKTHHIFSVGATKNDAVAPTPQNRNPRPRPDLTTFSIVEVGK
jgi:DNA-binding beta-propeller fold protein YncE